MRKTQRSGQLGIGIIFEKEAINTLDAKGEVLLTILSSLEQDESRSISENSTWGIRRWFEEYLSGKTVDYIKRMFEREEVQTWNGSTKWQATTLQSMLENEKYKGDAILQKSYTTDFLTKKRAVNQGEIQKFYIEDDHEPIIEPWIWECVQLEMARRKKYMEVHGINSYSHYTEQNPIAARIVCGNCNKVFTRKGWQSRNGDIRRVWQCSERYKVKGVMGCSNRHVEEATLRKVFIQAWNTLLENREQAVPEWEEAMKRDDLLARYRAKKFLELTKKAQPIDELDTDLMLRVLDYIKVYEEGMLVVVFLDGTEIEYRAE